jgi:hypothetical protein
MKKEELLLTMMEMLFKDNNSSIPSCCNDRKKNEEEKELLLVPGIQYFVRTVTYHIVGRYLKTIDGFAIFDKAVWVADSGRFSNALSDGFENQDDSELEPFPHNVRINVSSITDFTDYTHEIPLQQK